MDNISMSAKAILARFQGDYREALEYARSIARAYPHLADEYWRYVYEIDRACAESVPRSGVAVGQGE